MSTDWSRSVSVSVDSAEKRVSHPSSQRSMSASRAACRGSNSDSRFLHGFSPSVVRKSVKRDLRLPAMCQTNVAMEFPPRGAAASFSVSSCRIAPAASAL